MKLQEYKKTQFQTDLKGLKLEKPNNVISSSPEHFGIDGNTVFFGGKDWEHLSKDISNVEKDNLENFILCLFTMVAIDLSMHEYYKDSYLTFRAKTNSIKFGWSGFGPHFETPSKLLLMPEQKGAVDFKVTNVAEFVEFFITECNEAIAMADTNIKTNDFITNLLNDKQFKITPETEGSIFSQIHKELQSTIS